MKKSLIIFLLLVFNSLSFSQISGEIEKSGRKLIKENALSMESHVSGVVTFQISVNIEGEIIYATVINSETDVKSSPAKIKARNYLTSNFAFEPGTWFPKFHQGKVRIQLIKKD